MNLLEQYSILYEKLGVVNNIRNYIECAIQEQALGMYKQIPQQCECLFLGR